MESLSALNSTDLEAEAAATESRTPISGISGSTPPGLARFDGMVRRGESWVVCEWERQSLESLISLNSTEATGGGIPLSGIKRSISLHHDGR